MAKPTLFDKTASPAKEETAAAIPENTAQQVPEASFTGLALGWRRNAETKDYELLTFIYDPATLQVKISDIKNVGKLFGNVIIAFKKKAFLEGLVP